MAYGGFKDLIRRKASDKLLRDKSFNFAKNSEFRIMMDIKRGLASMAYKIFDKKNSGKTVKNEITSNKELSEELHKPIIKENKRKEKYNHFL